MRTINKLGLTLMLFGSGQAITTNLLQVVTPVNLGEFLLGMPLFIIGMVMFLIPDKESHSKEEKKQ